MAKEFYSDDDKEEPPLLASLSFPLSMVIFVICLGVFMVVYTTKIKEDLG